MNLFEKPFPIYIKWKDLNDSIFAPKYIEFCLKYIHLEMYFFIKYMGVHYFSASSEGSPYTIGLIWWTNADKTVRSKER